MTQARERGRLPDPKRHKDATSDEVAAKTPAQLRQMRHSCCMSDASEYEILTQRIAADLSSFFGVLTQRCDVRVVMPGRGTSNEVDVVWEGEIDGDAHRILIECKHYKRRVDQGRLHAFRSVLDDLSDDVPTTGVFATTVGYQAGAQSLAETYGIVILELRPPGPRDMAGRVTQIVLNVSARLEVVEEVNVEADWVAGEVEALASLPVLIDEASIHLPDGTSMPLRSALTEGERSPLGQAPTPPHRVVRDYPRGSVLKVGGEPVLGPLRISAVVGDSDSKATHTIGPGTEGIAHILKDAMTGATVWFQKDGRIRVVG